MTQESLSAPEVLEAGAIESVTRGEVDMQVATARRFPRNLSRFKKTALAMATIDAETAASCHYYLVKGGTEIEGPSVRLAEIAATCWGNLRAETRIVEEGARHVVAQATCWDMESNTLIRVESRRRITTRNGKRFGDDMIQTTCNAAASIAFRNAVFRVVPRAYIKPIFEQCKRVGAGDERSLGDRRRAMVSWFESQRVGRAQILAFLGREGLDDVTLDDMVKLQGIANAVRDGETTAVAAIVPEGKPDKPGPGKHKARKPREAPPEPDDVAKPDNPPAPPEPEPEPELREGALEFLGMIDQAETAAELAALIRHAGKRKFNKTETAAVQKRLKEKDSEVTRAPDAQGEVGF